MKIKAASNGCELLKLNKKSIFNNSFIANLSAFSEKEIVDNALCFNTDIVYLLGSPFIETIGTAAFESCCNLRYFDCSPKIIGNKAFKNCGNLKGFDFSKTNSIGEYAFSGSGLEKVKIEKCQIIKKGAFSYCFDLKTVILCNTSVIEEEAFAQSSLQLLILPPTSTYIKHNAFSNIIFLQNVICLSENPPEIEDDIFSSRYPAIFVPFESVDKYKKVWKHYKNYIFSLDSPSQFFNFITQLF